MINNKSSVTRSLVVALLSLLFISMSGADDAKLSKTISRSFNINPATKLEVVNKYGDVILNAWEKDSIKIIIVVTAFGKNREVSEKLLNRTDFDFIQAGEYITVTTQLDKSKGWFRDLWNEIGEYSKNILSKEQLNIDYELFLPDYVNLELTNKFGDVFVPDRQGKTRIDLSHGNLKMDNIQESAVLDLSFCEADIKSLGNATIYLKSSELELEFARDLTLKSSSSKIFIQEVDKVYLTSRTDKVHIDKVREVKGQGSFSKIWLQTFQEYLKMDMNYGSLSIDRINSSFQELDVTGKSTDFELNFAHNAYFKARIIAKEGKMDLPSNHNLKRIYTDGREKFVEASGHLGVISSTPADLEVNAQGGKVMVDFAAPDASSQKD